MFKGSTTALITPFKDNQIDFDALRSLVEFQISGGTDCILVNGTTAESPTLSDEESLSILQFVIKQVANRCKVIYGSGSNDTRHSITKSMAGEQAGAEGLLVVTPYYNKPTQEGLYRHFKAIAESVSIPIILYNVPGRTAANIEPATVKRLSKIHNIVAIKEASGNLAQMMKIRQLCGDSITLLSGDDGLNLPIFSIGGQGTISVTANIIPDRLKQLNVLWQTGKSTEALAAHMAMLELHDVMFIEANPVPVKTALHLMNKIQLEFRAPLCEMTEQNLKSLQSVLKDQKLI